MHNEYSVCYLIDNVCHSAFKFKHTNYTINPFTAQSDIVKTTTITTFFKL